jgi:hypothetical protein
VSALDWVERLAADLDLPTPALPPHPVEAIEWARSGAMALTGRANGPPRLSAGSPASYTRAALDVVSFCSGRPMPGTGVLSERAAIAGLSRQAPWTVGGSFRMVPTADGWLGLSLAREADRGLLPALVEAPVEGDGWMAVTVWAAGRPTEDVLARCVLLGLPAAAVAENPPEPGRPGVVATGGGARLRSGAPLVVDLSAMWAGPLGTRLLGLAGARVIKVESATRPDGLRSGAQSFYDLLHVGQESVVLDFVEERGLLESMLRAADVVVEASRPRALRQLGIRAEEYVAGGAIWLSITAYGRDPDHAMRVGFGDDVAVGAGLLARDDEITGPIPAGDALADPLTGVTAAAAVAMASSTARGWLLDLSMHDVAATAAQPPDQSPSHMVLVDGEWSVVCGSERVAVAAPALPRGTDPAPTMGAHTEAVRDEFS